jgi:peptide/nickel transport system ATP-binding protein
LGEGLRGQVSDLGTEPRIPVAESSLLQVEAVSLVYRTSRQSGDGPAVNNVSFDVRPGECVGIVGESGSGKTTLANCVAGLLVPTSGRILFEGKVINESNRKPHVPRVEGIQIIFQDPVSSLNPRRTVGSILKEILTVHRLAPRSSVQDSVRSLLDQVGLPTRYVNRRPGRLSGGQQQRVAIARALSFNPRLIVADEIVSSLDASVQAQILNLLDRLRQLRNLSIVLITHDLAVARQLCDRLAVMRRGEIVESGSVEAILTTPKHPYTKELLSAVPRLAAPPGVT